MALLLNKYCGNEGILNGDEIPSCVYRLLDRNCVNKGGLDLCKEVLWVSVGQRAAEIPAIKVGGLKRNSAGWPGAGKAGSNLVDWQNFF